MDKLKKKKINKMSSSELLAALKKAAEANDFASKYVNALQIALAKKK